jgi:hypothetical protein
LGGFNGIVKIDRFNEKLGAKERRDSLVKVERSARLGRPAARGSKVNEGAICRSVSSPPSPPLKHFKNPVGYLRVMLTPKITPEVAVFKNAPEVRR